MYLQIFSLNYSQLSVLFCSVLVVTCSYCWLQSADKRFGYQFKLYSAVNYDFESN